MTATGKWQEVARANLILEENFAQVINGGWRDREKAKNPNKPRTNTKKVFCSNKCQYFYVFRPISYGHFFIILAESNTVGAAPNKSVYLFSILSLFFLPWLGY